MLIGRDVGYLKIEDFKKLAELSVGVSKLINSLLNFK